MYANIYTNIYIYRYIDIEIYMYMWKGMGVWSNSIVHNGGNLLGWNTGGIGDELVRT
jgi:hypothetical protein